EGADGEGPSVKVETIALYFPSLAAGGVPRMMANLASALTEQGQYRVDLVVATNRENHVPRHCPGVRVVRLGAASVPGSLPQLYSYLRSTMPKVLVSGPDGANVVAVVAR